MKVAVIGLGERAASVLIALQRTGTDVQVAGYFDPSPAGLARLNAEGLCPQREFGDIHEALSPDNSDLVMIASPNHLHFEHLMLALDGTLPVFVEKPIVRTENESYLLANRLSKSTAPDVYVGLVLRSAPIVREILAIMREGHLGQIVSIDATEHLPPDHGGYLARNWRRKREWGGSYLLDKVCHDFDILSEIAGARAQRVISFGGRGIFRADREPRLRAFPSGDDAFDLWPGGWAADVHAFRSDGDVTDHQTALVEYSNGVQLSFHSNSSTSLRERRWFIAGTDGTLIADLVRNKLMWRRSLETNPPYRHNLPIEQAGHNGADVAMAADLVAALRDEIDYPVSPYQALEAGLTVMAIDKSMMMGQVVDCTAIWTTLDDAMNISG